MDFERDKRDGAQAGVADTMKDCMTAGKTNCDDEAETAFADSMGLEKTNGVEFKAKFQRFKKDAAASAAVKTTSACVEKAGADVSKLTECATLAKKEAAKALGGEDYTSMSGSNKAEFDAKFERMAEEARAKELTEAMRANKDKTEAERKAAALAIFKKSNTKTYTEDTAGEKDAKMDFEKAKREGAKAGLADTMKDCKTAGKTDCEDVAEQAFADSMGLTKADCVDF
jgi:hypothetical protein